MAFEVKLKEARALLQARQLEAAAEAIDTAMQEFGPRPALALLKSRVAQERGDLSAALAVVDDLLEANPSLLSAGMQRAQLLSQMDMSAEAVAEARKWAEQDQATPQTTIRLAASLRQAGDIAQSTDVLTALTAAHPNHAYAYVALAMSYAAGGETERALETVERALELDAGLLAAHQQKAVFLINSGRSEAALEVLSPLLEKRENWPSLLPHWARAMRELGRAEESCARLQEAVEAFPAVPPLHLQLAQTYRFLDQPEQSHTVLEKLSQRMPEVPAVTRALADSFLQLQKVDQALAVLSPPVGRTLPPSLIIVQLNALRQARQTNKALKLATDMHQRYPEQGQIV